MGRPEINIQPARTETAQNHRFLFLLLPGFSSLDLGSGVDSLAAANAAGADPAFDWRIIGETNRPVTSASGMTVTVDAALPHTQRGDCIVICGAQSRSQPASPELRAWLRQATRFGAQLCGLGGGAALLAQTGLIEGHRLSTHWKLQPALAELFPRLETVCSVFEEEQAVATCPGGATTLDLFSALIGRRCGAEIASGVADLLLYATVRASNDRQTRSDLCRIGTRHEKLGRAIRKMQDHLEEPLTPTRVAEKVGLSTRQLERLFQRYVGASPKTYLTTLRLERARLLLQQTQMRVIDVAIACGFSSASHFSKLYRHHFGISPNAERGTAPTRRDR